MKKLNGVTAITAAIIMGAGCATTKVMDASATSQLRGKHIACMHCMPVSPLRLSWAEEVVLQDQILRSQSPAEMLIRGTLIAPAVSMDQEQPVGDDFVTKYELEDPAALIEQKIAESLSRQFQFSRIDYLPGRQSSDAFSPSKAALLAPNADCVLLVRTTTWAFLGWLDGLRVTDKYRLVYECEARFVSIRERRVLAGTKVAYDEADHIGNGTSTRPATKHTLLANNAELIRQKLQVAADHCVDVFLDRVVGTVKITE